MKLNPAKRKALEAAGWRFGDAADFLEMTDEERQLSPCNLDLSPEGATLLSPGQAASAPPWVKPTKNSSKP